MPDKALRGRGLLGVGKAKGKRLGSGMGRPGRKKPIMTFEEEVNAGPSEALGIYASGGIEGKPHSTKRGRLSAAANFLNRAWGQKNYNKKKKKKEGTEV